MSSENLNINKDAERVIYTIGHSNHSLDHFLELLTEAGVTAVADVRSQPYSRRFPHFNRRALEEALGEAGAKYVFLGDELGARPKESRAYVGGRADYRYIAKSESFRKGLTRVETGAAKFCLALMCAERDPLDCHRTILVARHLQNRGAKIFHILSDGELERNEVTERRLLKQTKLENGDLFANGPDEMHLVNMAYDLRGKEIAYAADVSGAEVKATRDKT